MQLNPPSKLEEFFDWLKKESEKLWEKIEIDPKIYGFQIQKKTKWNPGLNVPQIEEYETRLGLKFPEIYKKFLEHMNGTNKLSINVYGNSGESYAYAPNYYAYPRDIEKIEKIIEEVCRDFNIKKQNIDGDKIPFILPITNKRFLIVNKEKENPIISIHQDEGIVYATSLKDFLIDDIFKNHGQSGNIKNIQVKFWLN